MKKTTFITSLLCCTLLSLSADTHQDIKTFDIKTLAEQYNITFGSALFTTVSGDLKAITFPFDKFENITTNGFFFDGSSVGFSYINKSDLLAKIDLKALYINPYIDRNIGNTGFAFCDVYDSSGKPFALCPRSLLKKALKEAQEAGFTCDCGVELEFFVFRNNNNQLEPCDTDGYCDTITNIELNGFITSMFYGLTKAGIKLEKMHHEVAPGQYEFILKHDDPLKIADSLQLAKYLMHTIGKQNGYTISFMPKPIAGENGSGMHIHFSLWDTTTKTNAFYNAKAPIFLSDTALHFIAGNLHAIKELNILLNPSINSYKRLVPGYEAPTYLAWGAKNRSTAIRIPEVTKQDHEASNGAPARIEFRSPDASCNPYLAFATIIFAGLEGVKNKQAVPNNTEKNLYHVSQEELDELGIRALPGSLEEATRSFEKSEFAKTVLGEVLHAYIVELKTKECNDFTNTIERYNPFTITDWEYKFHKLKQ